MAKREVWITDNSVNFNKLRILSTKKSKPSHIKFLPLFYERNPATEDKLDEYQHRRSLGLQESYD